MATVHTDLGPGEIIAEDTVRGRKSYRVAGQGFDVWLDETKIRIPPTHLGWAPVDFDNSTALPYNPDPQYPAIPGNTESTIQPIHHIDPRERLRDTDSVTFAEREETHPSPKFGSQHEGWAQLIPLALEGLEMAAPALGRAAGGAAIDQVMGGEDKEPPGAPPGAPPGTGDPGELGDEGNFQEGFGGGPGKKRFDADELINALRPGPGWGPLIKPSGLSDKYIDITANADYHHNPILQFRHDPDAYISRVGNVLDETDAASDIHLAQRQYMDLVEADPQIREAAWKDVREKGVRLRGEGRVAVHDISPSRIYATVEGDNGVYDVMISREGMYGGVHDGYGLRNWRCACLWGQWAWKRKYSYVGRLCSHGYAAFLEMQSANERKRGGYPKRSHKTADALQMIPTRLTPELVVNDADDASYMVDVTKDQRKDTGPGDIMGPEGYPKEKSIEHFSSLMALCDRQGSPYPRELVAYLEKRADRSDEDLEMRDYSDWNPFNPAGGYRQNWNEITETPGAGQQLGDFLSGDVLTPGYSVRNPAQEGTYALQSPFVAEAPNEGASGNGDKPVDTAKNPRDPGSGLPTPGKGQESAEAGAQAARRGESWDDFEPGGTGGGLGGAGMQANGKDWRPSTETTGISGDKYTVRPGDTGQNIADRAGVGVDTLKAPSGDVGMLRPGDVLDTSNKIPGKSPVAPTVSPITGNPLPTHNGVPINTDPMGGSTSTPAAKSSDPALSQVGNPSAVTEGTKVQGSALHRAMFVAGNDFTASQWWRKASADPSTSNAADPNAAEGTEGDVAEQDAAKAAELEGGAKPTTDAAKPKTDATKTDEEKKPEEQAAQPATNPAQPAQGPTQQPQQPQDAMGGMGGAMDMLGPMLGAGTDLASGLMPVVTDALGGLGGGGGLASGLGGLGGGIASGIGDAVGGLMSGIGGIFGSRQTDGYGHFVEADRSEFGYPSDQDHIPFEGSGPQPPLKYTTSEDEMVPVRNKMEDVTGRTSGPSMESMRDKPKRQGAVGITRAGTGPKRPPVEPEVVRVWAPKVKQGAEIPDIPDPYSRTAASFREGAAPDDDPEPFRTASASDDFTPEPGVDIVAQFQRSAAAENIMSEKSGGQSGDDIAGNASAFLQRTAGRNFSMAEQAELMNERHPLGARNLDQLDLGGTHYEAENSVGLFV